MTRRIAALSTFFLLALPAVALAAEENGTDEEKFNPASEWTLHEWIPIHLGPINLSITKAVAYLMLASVLTIVLCRMTSCFPAGGPEFDWIMSVWSPSK